MCTPFGLISRKLEILNLWLIVTPAFKFHILEENIDFEQSLVLYGFALNFGFGFSLCVDAYLYPYKYASNIHLHVLICASTNMHLLYVFVYPLIKISAYTVTYY